MKKLTGEQIYKILEIVLTAILSVAAILLCASCTMSMSISKYNQSSPQRVEHSSSVSADSASVVIPIK